MPNILKEICNKKKEELEIVKSKCSLTTIKKLLPKKLIEILKN